MHAPIRRLGGHDIEVAVQQQGAALGVRALEPREHVAPPWCAGFDVMDRVTDLLQLIGYPAGTDGLALGGFGVTGVGGVEADEGADEVDHLGFGAGGRRHSHHSYH